MFASDRHCGNCLVLGSRRFPPYVPTLLSLGRTPFVSGYGEQFQLARVLGWSANPVVALFLGGFALSVAASRHGIDNLIARVAVRLSAGHRLGLVALVIAATATLSMWMSNIAAAAMMLVALHPLFVGTPKANRFRRATLMGIAIGANFGGIATPIGTGPNAIAIAAVSNSVRVTFLDWMVFALPLALGLMIAGTILLTARFQLRGLTECNFRLPVNWRPAARNACLLHRRAWLTEPIHGTSSESSPVERQSVWLRISPRRRQENRRRPGLIAAGSVWDILDQGDYRSCGGRAWQEFLPWLLFPALFSAAFLAALSTRQP